MMLPGKLKIFVYTALLKRFPASLSFFMEFRMSHYDHRYFDAHKWTELQKNYEAAFSDFTGTFPQIIFCVIMYNVSFYYAAVSVFV